MILLHKAFDQWSNGFVTYCNHWGKNWPALERLVKISQKSERLVKYL